MPIRQILLARQLAKRLECRKRAIPFLLVLQYTLRISTHKKHVIFTR